MFKGRFSVPDLLKGGILLLLLLSDFVFVFVLLLLLFEEQEEMKLRRWVTRSVYSALAFLEVNHFLITN